jgi:hypothetical protein
MGNQTKEALEALERVFYQAASTMGARRGGKTKLRADLVLIQTALLRETSEPTTGAELIAAERKRQVEVEGYTAERDQANATVHTLTQAARCYAIDAAYRQEVFLSGGWVPNGWPWLTAEWKPSPSDRKRELVKAGALIAAAIDLLRAELGELTQNLDDQS